MGGGDNTAARGATVLAVGAAGVPAIGTAPKTSASSAKKRAAGSARAASCATCCGSRTSIRKELDEILKRLRELEDGRNYRDANELLRLQEQVAEGLKRFEYGLRRKVGDEADRALVSGSDEVPQEFRKLVEEYYRSLSKGKQ